jgi:prepilin-type N-terminal cleavage/methylation domain-containing protein
MLRAVVRFLRTSRSERGFTLVELVVATSLLSLVTAAAFGTVIIMQHQSLLTTDRFTAEGEAQTIADRITKDLRTAVAPSSTTAAFASADTNDVSFYASLADPNGPTKLHAYVALQPSTNVYVFHEDSTKPDTGGTPGNYAYTTASAVSRLDGRYLDTSQPIFTYYNSDGTQLTAPVTGTANLRSIDSVGVNLRVRVHPNSPIVVISTLIHVRNVDYNPNS